MIDKRTVLDDLQWAEVEEAVAEGMSFNAAAVKYGAKFGVPGGLKVNSVRKRARVHNWATEKRMTKTLASEIAKAARDWTKDGESVRATAFDRASRSIALFRPKAPKNFRELESAVKIARQAAGLDTADVQIATLINLNERMENFADEQPIEEADVIEVELEPDPVLPEHGDRVAGQQPEGGAPPLPAHLGDAPSFPTSEDPPPASSPDDGDPQP